MGQSLPRLTLLVNGILKIILGSLSLFRSLRSAKEAMEDDIRETLASENPRFDEADFLRSGELSARIADEIFWDIEAKELAE